MTRTVVFMGLELHRSFENASLIIPKRSQTTSRYPSASKLTNVGVGLQFHKQVRLEATEELKQENPIPVWVRVGAEVSYGNQQLIQLGAIPFPPEPWGGSLLGLLEEGEELHRKQTPRQLCLDVEEGGRGETGQEDKNGLRGRSY